MFRFACFSLLILSSMKLQANTARNLRWADLVESRTYKVDREIQLNQNKNSFTIRKGQEMRLLDFRPLPMINVFLAEFKLTRCGSSSFSSEMILIEVEQPAAEPVAIGVDMAKKCVLEVFLEKKDYNARSMFR